MFIHPLHNNILQFRIFDKYHSLVHFSTLKFGGCSKGNYSSFNLGEYAGDNPQDINKNRNLLTSYFNLNVEDLYLPHQTHEDKILCIDKEFLSESVSNQKERLDGIDALITNEKNICIGVTTADCVPILIYDEEKHVVAAVHAGWRSTVAFIVVKTIEKMQEVYGCLPQNMKAGIAPSISQKHFEVGKEVVESFERAGFSLDKIAYRNSLTDKIHIDLPLANQILLNKAGIFTENIEMSGLCTYSDPDSFFSARRQGIQSGRMVTGAVLL